MLLEYHHRPKYKGICYYNYVLGLKLKLRYL